MKYRLSKLFILRTIIFRSLIFLCLYLILIHGVNILENFEFFNDFNAIIHNSLYILQLAIINLFIILGLISPVLEYFTWSYFIFKDLIEIRYGLLFKRYICIKIDKIKYINICENPVDIILRIKSISIYTAGGKVNIPAIKEEKIKIFQSIVKESS